MRALFGAMIDDVMDSATGGTSGFSVALGELAELNAKGELIPVERLRRQTDVSGWDLLVVARLATSNGRPVFTVKSEGPLNVFESLKCLPGF
jgi:hypothetical protein